MSDLPYQAHQDTLDDARTRQYNGFTTDQIVAYAIAKEIGLGRLMKLATPVVEPVITPITESVILSVAVPGEDKTGVTKPLPPGNIKITTGTELPTAPSKFPSKGPNQPK